MHFGVGLFFTDYSMTPAALGKALEERGFESVWAAEHSHIPLSRRSPWPGGGELPKQYYDVMDPFVTLTAAAAATTTLKVGTGVCLVNQRDPIQTAKLVASIDQVSGGPFPVRHRRWLERRGDGRSRHGVHHPRQAGAGTGGGDEGDLDGDKAGISRRVCQFRSDDGVAEAGSEAVSAGDRRRRLSARRSPGGAVWRGLDSAGRPSWTYGDVFETVPKFRAMLAEAGRDAASCPVTLFGVAEDADLLKRYRDLGVARVTAALPAAKEDVVLPILDRWAALIRQTA